MSRRDRGVRPLVGLLSVSGLVFVAAAAMYAQETVSTPHAGIEGPNEPLGAVLAQLAIIVAFTAVGAVVAARRPRHPIGWLLLGAGWLFALSELAHGYAHSAVLGGRGDAGLGAWAAVVGIVTFLAAWAAVTMFLPLLFPDGRLLSRRWRIVAWGGGLGAAGSILGALLSPGPLSSFPEVVNPAGLSGAAAVAAAVGSLGEVVWALGTFGAAVSVVVRLVRPRGATRQQFKWVALPAIALVVFIVLNEMLPPGFLAGGGWVVYALALGGLPVGVGIAVLRYRLYEIDRIVSRTVAYALLTVLLLGVYVAGVVGFGGIVRVLTGQESGELVVAGSTLAVAALFQPARRRIQAGVDRRFNRARYNAGRIVDAFAYRLRDEVEIEVLCRDLRAVVVGTLEPAHTSVWLPADPTGHVV